MGTPVFTTRTVSYIGMPFCVCSECRAWIEAQDWTQHKEWHQRLEQMMYPPITMKISDEEADRFRAGMMELRTMPVAVMPAGQELTITFAGDDDADPDRAAWEYR